MRRRRRQPTQIIKKKSFSSTSYPQLGSVQQSKSSWKRFFSTFFFILIIAAVSYFIYDVTLNKDVTFEEKQPEVTDQTESEPAEESAPPPEPAEQRPFKQNVQAEILNGCGVNGVAKSFQVYLRGQGFDVVNTENYTENNKLRWDVANSFIIDHVGNPEQAKAVARSLNIPEDRVVEKNTPNPLYDVSVVIGKDYRQLNGSE